jgi:hypothetical protein
MWLYATNAIVAISTVNFLPEIGLYNVAIGIVVEIVYQDRPVGPNDKQHYHLPDYVLIFPPIPETAIHYSTMGQPTQNSEYTIYSKCKYKDMSMIH